MANVMSAEAISKPRVSWFELFYDLVLVATILHGSEVFTETRSWETGFWLAVTLLVMLTVWMLTTLTFNTRRDDWALRRFLALVQMLAVVVASLSISREDGLSDWIGFVALSIAFGVISILYALKDSGDKASSRGARRISLASGASALIFLVGAALPETDAPLYANPSTYALGLGIALAVVPLFTMRLGQLSSSGELDRDHLAERMGQIVIIALGESFADLMLSLGALRSIPNPLYLALTFIVIYCLWAIYFRSILPTGIPQGEGRLRVWIACHYLLLFGLIGTAGGCAALTVLPLDDGSAAYASYRISLPLLYTMLALALLTWLAGSERRPLVMVHLVAAALLLVLSLVGGLVFPGSPMAVGVLAALVVVMDASSIAWLVRRKPDVMASA